MERERLVAGERLEPGRPGAVSDRDPGEHRRGRRRDLLIGNAQQDDVRARAVGPASERAEDLIPHLRDGVREREAEPPAPNDSYALTARKVVG
jgi:hypothetical protein